MLYYIVPPIVIVISLAILIVFLFRKFSDKDNISQEVIQRVNVNGHVVGYQKKILSIFSNIWLRILERTMQRLKLFSLKLHNVSNSWFHSIKSRRESGGQNITESGVLDGLKKETDESAFKIDNAPLKKSVESVEKKGGFFRMKRSDIEKLPAAGGNLYKRGKDFLKNNNGNGIKKEIKTIQKTGMEEELIKRIAINPKDIEAYERLGDYYSEMSNFRDSMECYKQVIKLSPSNGKARMKMKNLELLLKK